MNIIEHTVEVLIQTSDTSNMALEVPGDVEVLVTPVGAQGAPGGSYVHTQALASDVWIVNHNLGIRPNVAVFSVGGVEIMAGIIHVSVNQVQIQFVQPMAGSATCS